MKIDVLPVKIDTKENSTDMLTNVVFVNQLTTSRNIIITTGKQGFGAAKCGEFGGPVTPQDMNVDHMLMESGDFHYWGDGYESEGNDDVFGIHYIPITEEKKTSQTNKK